MTASGQRLVAANVAAPGSTALAPEQATEEITACTPLPMGWSSFCQENTWYAAAPWNVFELLKTHGEAAEGLVATVMAPTYIDLYGAVDEQTRLYNALPERPTL